MHKRLLGIIILICLGFNVQVMGMENDSDPVKHFLEWKANRDALECWLVAPIKPCLFGKTSNYAWVYSPEKIKDLQNSMCPNKALEALCALNDCQGRHKKVMISSVKVILGYGTKVKDSLAEKNHQICSTRR